MNFPVPRDSADFYRQSDRYAAIYGDDFFFVTGSAQPPASPGEDQFSVVSQVQFVLSNRIGWNPSPPPSGDPEIQKMRAGFTAWREEKAERQYQFPVFKEIRQGKADDLQLLSGGAFVFAVHDFGQGPETRLALFRRGAPPKVMTDANGLVNARHTAEKEMAEEYAFVLLKDGRSVALALHFQSSHALPLHELTEIKRSQEKTIRANLATRNIEAGRISFQTASLDLIPAQDSQIALYDAREGAIDTLSGNVGFEHDNNTWVYRKAGLLWAPRDYELVLTDGEFDRTGGFYTPEQFAAMIEAKDTLSSTAAFGRHYLENWPRPVAGSRKILAPEFKP